MVAAGNRQGKGKDLRISAIYPARYGGRGHFGQYNLITVAALDRRGGLAEFSNYSPGLCRHRCAGRMHRNIELRPGEADIRPGPGKRDILCYTPSNFRFGSAAFRARAGPRHHGRHQSQLLAGADIRPELASAIVHGRVLILVKALSSIFFDVVETKDDAGRTTVRGRLKVTRPISFATFCTSDPDLPDSARIMKVIPRFDGTMHPSARALVYWMDRDEELNTSDCTLKGRRPCYRRGWNGKNADAQIGPSGRHCPSSDTSVR